MSTAREGTVSGGHLGATPTRRSDVRVPPTLSLPRLGRRRFIGFLTGGTTLVAAADLLTVEPAAAVVPTGPQPAEIYDLNDALTDSCRPTANLITVEVHEGGM